MTVKDFIDHNLQNWLRVLKVDNFVGEGLLAQKIPSEDIFCSTEEKHWKLNISTAKIKVMFPQTKKDLFNDATDQNSGLSSFMKDSMKEPNCVASS